VDKGPDFIGVGAQRAGTTWLYAVLNRHPEVWMTPVKELHWFDDGARARWMKHFRARKLHRGRLPTAWDLRYFLLPRSDRWYASLFREGRRRGLLAGEITPAYALLEDGHFERMLRLNPETRFIFSMRDPIDRGWSNYLNSVRKGQDAVAVPEGGDYDLDRVRQHMVRSDYFRTVERLDRLVAPERVHYCFFEDMVADPEAYAVAILRFLGVEPGDLDTVLPGRAINSSARGRGVPDGFARVAAPIALEQLEPLCRRFPDGPPPAWRARAAAIAGAERLEPA
jgi:hypothetical protein